MKLASKKGFSLIEIIMVVVIIGILVSMAVTNFSGRGQEAKIAAARADIEANISQALDLYELDNGRYPTTEQGLRALIVQPDSSPVPENWNGPYLKKKSVPVDPWRRDYNYESPGIHNTEDYDLSSTGPDGVESPDDIINWNDDLDF